MQYVSSILDVSRLEIIRNEEIRRTTRSGKTIIEAIRENYYGLAVHVENYLFLGLSNINVRLDFPHTRPRGRLQKDTLISFINKGYKS